MVKVNIISGFLGAGKTTLIKKLISGAMQGEKVILLENEYGEVGVDGGFMKDSGITVTELNSGCICCTLAGDFQQAIDELITTYHPDRLLVEPTGVGKLSDIRRAVEEAKEHHDLVITGCATVVDAGRAHIYLKNFGEFFIDQLKSAETIILSRTQNLTAEKTERARAIAAEQNPAARIITTPWDDLDAAMILDTIEHPAALLSLDDLPADDEEEEHDHHHDHDEGDEHGHHHHHDHDEGDENEHDHHHDHDDDDENEHDHHHHHDEDDEHGHHHHHGHDHEHHHHHHGHDADEVFDNIGVETAKRFSEEALRRALDCLGDEAQYGTILRAKGIVQTEDNRWIHFDYVPGETDVRYGSADYTGRLCVIGTGIREDALRGLFGI